MALGTAVVATDVNGTLDYVVDGVTGRLVPPGDAAALAAVIDELVDDEAQCERLGRNAAAWAAEHLRPEPFAETVLGLCRP
jgi:glycosyltransferase involved in cell wall biosynthesis